MVINVVDKGCCQIFTIAIDSRSCEEIIGLGKISVSGLKRGKEKLEVKQFTSETSKTMEK